MIKCRADGLNPVPQTRFGQEFVVQASACGARGGSLPTFNRAPEAWLDKNCLCDELVDEPLKDLSMIRALTPRYRRVLTVFLAILTAFGLGSARGDILDNWTTIQVSTNYYGLTHVAYGAGRYVAFGQYSDYGVLLSSEDGKQWTFRVDGNSPTGVAVSYSIGLVYSEPYFFALGGFGTSAMSTNGINWWLIYNPYAIAAAYGNGIAALVVADPYGPTRDIYTATNVGCCGFDFRPQNLNRSLGDIAYGSGRFVALGVGTNSGHIFRSVNGTFWGDHTIPGGSSVSFANGLFFIPWVPGTNLISTDGLNWATAGTGINLTHGKVYYRHGVFISAAYNNQNSYFASSIDGTNWINYPNSPLATDFASDGFRMVNVGYALNPADPLHPSGFVFYSDPLVGLGMNSTTGAMTLFGVVGRTYQIESTDSLSSTGSNNWQLRFVGSLPSDPYIWSDPTAADTAQRFYRAALQP